ncbi:MAG: hypothetical protein HY815_13045 [Candidatus Riflebacteria bacterium]|nr:hypothetical protein [Candidatus Riflebacteria bacterium]
MVITLLSLALSALLIVLLGIRMTRLADRIADSSHLAKGFVGMLLLAAATSLPEVVTSLTAVLSGAPGLAFGNVFGSNVVNLSFLFILDLMIAVSIFSIASREHVTTGLWAILLSLVAIGGIATVRVFGWPGWPFSLALVVLYVRALRTSYAATSSESDGSAIRDMAGPPRHSPWGAFGLAALGVVVVGLVLTRACESLARETGLGMTFVGSLVLALVTSLPELVVSIEAVRLGSLDMSLGNLAGSNLFNVTIVAMCDGAGRAACCAAGSPAAVDLWTVPAASACLPAAVMSVVMMGLFVWAVSRKSATTVAGRVSPISLALLLLYILSNALLFGR